MEQDGIKNPEFKITKYDGNLTPIKDNNLAYLYATLYVHTGPEYAGNTFTR